MYDINDETPIGVLTVGQFKSLVCEILRESQMQNNTSIEESPKEILTIKELSEYTGQSKSHIYKLTSNFKIPHYKKASDYTSNVQKLMSG